MKRQIVIDVEFDRPFDTAEQERYFLASIEEAMETEIWFDMLASEDMAPQQAKDVRASFR